MMKFLLATAAATALTAGAASAEGIGFGGYGEYALEAETFEFGAEASYGIADLTLSAKAVLVKPNGVDLGLDGVTLGAKYAVTEKVAAYGKVDLDSDLAYDETTLGVSFKF